MMFAQFAKWNECIPLRKYLLMFAHYSSIRSSGDTKTDEDSGL